MTCTKCKTERDAKPWFCGECDWKNRPMSEKCYNCEASRTKATAREKRSFECKRQPKRD